MFNVAREVSDPPSMTLRTFTKSIMVTRSITGKHCFRVIQAILLAIFVNVRRKTILSGDIFHFANKLVPRRSAIIVKAVPEYSVDAKSIIELAQTSRPPPVQKLEQFLKDWQNVDQVRA
jgi:hypothetical protein